MGLGLMYDRDLPIPVRSKPHGLYDGRHIGSGAYCVGFRYIEPQSFLLNLFLATDELTCPFSWPCFFPSLP